MADRFSLVYQSSNTLTKRNWVNLAYPSEFRVSLLAEAACGEARSHRFHHQLRLCQDYYWMMSEHDLDENWDMCSGRKGTSLPII